NRVVQGSRGQLHRRHPSSMTALAVAAGVIAGAVHIGFWVIESLMWRRPAVHRLCGIRDQASAGAVAGMGFNQGFYNLFLGLGAIAGAWLVARESTMVLLAFSCIFMVGAALVLLATSRKMWRGAVVQGLPPLLALASLAAV